MTTQSRIQEIAERCERATELSNEMGTYCERGIVSYFLFCEKTGEKIIRVFARGNKEQEELDAAFHSSARTDIPFLLEQLTKAVEVIEKIGAHGCCVMHNDRGCPGCTAKDFLKEMRNE